MKTLNKIKDWFLNLETIKTLNYRDVYISPIFAILSTMAFWTVTKSNQVGALEIIISLLVTLNLIALSFNKNEKNRLNKLTNFCTEHSNVIYTMIVITTFQVLSIWTYGEHKLMIPQSVQSMVLIALPMFKWCVFIYVLMLSRVANEKRNKIKKQN